ncbi:Flp family type IVb pilin [Limnobacter sp.]|uniref:Flp family type IVb pilin n=1 Tax=Limnobacter sp. TaxID=2003368 RepID=UPI00258A5000|nr:Flp family type IVb pilin [Limnobacter sp.]
MKKPTHSLKKSRKISQTGASLIEYAVIAALIVGIAVLVFPTLQTGLSTAFTKISAQLSK